MGGGVLSREKRDLSAAAPCPSQRPTPIRPRTDRRRRCCRFASHTTARVTARVPVSTRKTERQARVVAQEKKTSVRQPCNRVKLKSSHRCSWTRTSTTLDRQEYAYVLSTSQPLAFARSSTCASSPPTSALYYRPLWQLAVFLLVAPPLRSLPTPPLRSSDAGARFDPKSTHKRSSRLSTRRWSALRTSQESPTMGPHKAREGQGACKVHHDRRLASLLAQNFRNFWVSDFER